MNIYLCSTIGQNTPKYMAIVCLAGQQVSMEIDPEQRLWNWWITKVIVYSGCGVNSLAVWDLEGRASTCYCVTHGNWLKSIKLDWPSICVVTLDTGSEPVDALLKHHLPVFANWYGKINDFHATVHLKPGAVIVGWKPTRLSWQFSGLIGLHRLLTSRREIRASEYLGNIKWQSTCRHGAISTSHWWRYHDTGWGKAAY